MKDPLVHVEKAPMPNFGQAHIRNLVATATGLVGDLPKSVGTGCGKRRKLSQTSNNPRKVTCLPCREWAKAEELKWAEMAESALSFDIEPEVREQIADQAAKHREAAKEFS